MIMTGWNVGAVALYIHTLFLTLNDPESVSFGGSEKSEPTHPSR